MVEKPDCMPLFILSLIVFIYLWNTVQSNQRKILLLTSLAFYIVLIIFEQFYLEHFFLRSFSLSDPTNYFEETKDLSANELIQFLSSNSSRSNQFYYLLNWFYFRTFFSAPVYAIMLNITNTLVYLCSVILVTKAKKSIDILDILLLYHPYLLVMLIRNVRDSYIIFFTTLAVIIFLKSKFSIKSVVGIIAISIGMYFIRSFFIVLFMIFIWLSLLKRFQNTSKIFYIVVTILCSVAFLYVYKDAIKIKLASSYISTAFFHYGENVEQKREFEEIVNNNSSALSIGIQIIKSTPKSICSFLLTPSPVKHAQNYLKEKDGGIWNIYTDLDNILIVAGSFLNYLLVLPLFFKIFMSYKQVPYPFILTIIFIIMIYSLFQFGITDIRIKFTNIYFVVSACIFAGIKFENNIKDIISFSGSFLLLGILTVV